MAHTPNHPSTLPNVLQEKERKRANREVREANVQKRRDCIEQGGTWTVVDQETLAGSCELQKPETQEPVTEAPVITKLTPEEKANAQLRNETIITDRFGNERILTEEERLRGLTEFGGIGAAEALETKEETARKGAELSAQLAQLETTPELGGVVPSELAGTRQTKLRAVQGAVDLSVTRGLQFASATATLAVGAVIVAGQAGPQVAVPEELVTVPAAAFLGGKIGGAVGTVFGAIEGYYKGRSQAIQDQASGFVGAKAKILRSTKTTMTRSLSNSWSGRGDKEDALIMFEKGWNDALDAWGQLQVDTQNDVQLRRGVDGTTTLVMYEQFFKEGGQGQQFRAELDLAFISAPDIERSIFWTNQADINELTPLPQ